jgi:hypothetical protein
VLAVVDRLEIVEAQQFGQLACIDLVTLAAFFQQSILSWITHQDFRDVRFQQVVQPGRPGSFFKRDVQVSAQPVDKERLFIMCGSSPTRPASTLQIALPD